MKRQNIQNVIISEKNIHYFIFSRLLKKINFILVIVGIYIYTNNINAHVNILFSVLFLIIKYKYVL